jgi:hypothetical protein
MDTLYALGRVPKITIEMPDGSEVIVQDANVLVNIEQEHLDCHILTGGWSRVVASENRTVEIKTNNPTEDLMRLIRGD